jgi:predicted nucleic acid-binding protein
MVTSLSSCVVDTNILIDLYRGGVHRELFRLPFTVLAPDVIVAELIEPPGRTLLDSGLQVVEFSGAEVLAVVDLSRIHPEVSINDVFALALARKQQLVLLTGDKRLRRIAELEYGLHVHGTLWVLDQLVKHKIISSFHAARDLRDMLQSGSRLPKADCDRRIRKWSTMA